MQDQLGNKTDKVYYYHPDHLGSTNYITNASGKIHEHTEYFPFGESWASESQNTQANPKLIPYLFTGKELDVETQLYYYGARYYDPRTSVWQSPDPILAKYLPTGDKKKDARLPGAGGVFNSGNLNLFAYTAQNPVKFIDPDGKLKIEAGASGTGGSLKLIQKPLGSLAFQGGYDGAKGISLNASYGNKFGPISLGIGSNILNDKNVSAKVGYDSGLFKVEGMVSTNTDFKFDDISAKGNFSYNSYDGVTNFKLNIGYSKIGSSEEIVDFSTSLSMFDRKERTSASITVGAKLNLTEKTKQVSAGVNINIKGTNFNVNTTVNINDKKGTTDVNGSVSVKSKF